MVKQKHVPAIYPPPDSIKLPDQRIVAVNRKTRTITLAGSPPPELVAAAEVERKRLDLTAKITGYAATCCARVMPHFGERPKNISAAKWRDIEHRIRLTHCLPVDAPPEAHDAFKALKTINRLVDALVAAGDYPEAIEHALCLAIDLGQLLQRGQTQIDVGPAVQRGKANVTALTTSNAARLQKSEARKRIAIARYHEIQRANPSWTKSVIITDMDSVLDADGRHVYGSERTLVEYLKGV